MAMVCRGGALKGGLVELVEAACWLVEAAEDERVQHEVVRHCHGTQTPQRVRSIGENAPPQRAHAPVIRIFFRATKEGSALFVFISLEWRGRSIARGKGFYLFGPS